ncbi:YcnI family protein [uncultured Leifsonia sp.]|uniref:YcnI family copper-binding membrane protein n=1 Tax=uncultured Leifsonia sp. TaxID=340359 RepID=UPI0025F2B4C0|nr:YcnI family protein [uncultured Leifsonia sp.]
MNSSTSRSRLRARTAVVAGAASLAAMALALAAPLAASAHVHVDPDQAAVGSYATLTFKVPTESATAGTVKLEVDLPTDTPLGSVSYQPLAGWSTQVVTETLAKPIKTDDGTVTQAPVKVVWTAEQGVQIAPGQFQQFVISAGAMPDTGSIVLPTHQYYSDGTVVNWDEKTPASGAEPEHPAPTVYITDAPPPADGAATPGLLATPTAVAPAAPAAASPAAAATAIGLGIAGLVLGAVALVVSVLALTRRSRAVTSPAAQSTPASATAADGSK